MLEGCVAWPVELAEHYREKGYWRGIDLGEWWRCCADEFAVSTALIEGSRQWSYRELDAWVERLAGGILEVGFEPGQRVLLQLPNKAEFVALCLAFFRIGVIPVLALPAHREKEIRHLAEASQAVAYVIPDTHLGFDYRPMARTVLDNVETLRSVFVVGEPGSFAPFSALEGEPRSVPAPAAEDVAVMLLSGGTTGLPKLIPRTHNDYLYNARTSAERAGFTEDTRYLAVLPVAHNFPLACPGLLGTFDAGGTVVLCPDPSPDTAFALIEKEGITVAALIPTLVRVWLEFAPLTEADLSSLTCLQVGGARLKVEVAAQVGEILGCGLQQVYGMAEGLLCMTAPGDPGSLVLNTQGCPISPGDEVRVVDDQGRDLPDGEIGELLVRGPYTLRGYYRAEEHNRRSFTEGGFYRSGDRVRRLASGYLVVEGREKDIINRGGEKVPVEDVENHLLSHPSVADVALIGMPHNTLGECNCACVIARGEAPRLSELNAHLSASGLAAYKLLDRLEIIDRFPLTRLGKVNRRQLAEQFHARVAS